MQRVAFNSTLLQAAVYQDPGAILELEFRGGTVYRYLDVPQRTWQELLWAQSKGGYFNQHIRNCFAYTRLRLQATRSR